jgi:hypothetical protein
MDKFIKDVKNFSKVKGKLNTFITFLLFDQSDEEIFKLLDHKIKIVMSMKDGYKRQRALEKIIKIKDDIRDYSDDYFKGRGIVYFVNETLNKIELNKVVMKVVREEFRDNIFYENGDYYETEYIIDMLTNFTFYNLLLMDNKKAYLYHINKNKTKLLDTVHKLDENNILDCIKKHFQNNSQYIIGGTCNFKNTFCKNNKGLILEDIKILSFKPDKIEHIKNNVFDIYKEKDEEKILETLNEYTGNMHQYENVVLFNNERIIKFLENFLVKTLIIHINSPIYERIKDMEIDYESFEYYVLTSKKDECKNFLRDYEGAIAIMRYEMPKESFDII